MAEKPTAPRVMSGSHGYVWWDGDLLYEISKFEATLKVERDDVKFAGDMMKDTKLTGLGGEFSFTVKKVYSRGQIKLAKALRAGKDPRSQLVGTLDDPDAYGRETVVLSNCAFNDVTLMTFESGSLGEEEFSGVFTDFDYPDTVAPR